MAEYEYVGDGRPDGTIVGRTSSEKVGFYGTTPAVQPSGSGQAAVTSTITTTLATNTVLETDLTATITLVNQLRSDLVTLGLIKGSA